MRLRRILLALDAGGAVPSALSLAVTIASRFGGQLEALLLAQAELTRAAEFPFASEVSLLFGLERPLNAPIMRRSLQTLSARVQSMMTQLADPARIPWSLQVTERRQWEGLLAAPGEGSLLVLTHAGHHVLASLAPAPGGLYLLHDDSPAGQLARALAVALEPQCAHTRWSDPGDAGLSPAADVPEVARLLADLRRLRPGILILPAARYREIEGVLRPLIARLECTVLLVG
ncbi:hypothetical protein TVNIR_3577 [Thioalkalivibrio nitratireducens DSM 14787]|uniref:UspA domain-containing protein n=1 Tax=Thioalkalivibrio nitratireducens (strain DSM 14787 / UNIQEM 213 / ALEN2) TaxID=1255043 RepID=L0E1T9_THIND|nr:hypothetical protein TVNIR_3577 [Thioalkalivibrio nitratireducens DSM 14787]